jgi:hypothetical protein
VALIVGSLLTLLEVALVLTYPSLSPGTPDPMDRRHLERNPHAIGLRGAHCRTVCMSITLYADHIDRLKYTSLPVDQGCIIGA